MNLPCPPRIEGWISRMHEAFMNVSLLRCFLIHVTWAVYIYIYTLDWILKLRGGCAPTKWWWLLLLLLYLICLSKLLKHHFCYLSELYMLQNHVFIDLGSVVICSVDLHASWSLQWILVEKKIKENNGRASWSTYLWKIIF